jgi:hypothetical protein
MLLVAHSANAPQSRMTACARHESHRTVTPPEPYAWPPADSLHMPGLYTRNHELVLVLVLATEHLC